ncbi:hypothetical protein SLE2022_276670 [Rubroshorea leprosula]
MASSSSSPLELTLSLKPSYQPKTIQNVLKDLQEVKNPLDKLSVLSDHIHQHEEELNFIKQIKRQVPQCGLFLMDAIKTLTEESEKIKKSMESGGRKPLVEFLPTKRKEYENDFAHTFFTANHESKRQRGYADQVQTFNGVEEQSFYGSLTVWRGHVCGARGLDSIIPRAQSAAHGRQNLMFHHPTINNYQPKPLSQPIKSSRMTWTDKLHDTFVKAVKLAGGIEVAAPKQIREIMQIDGLTNDQIKSHLQKYRLHYHQDPKGSS